MCVCVRACVFVFFLNNILKLFLFYQVSYYMFKHDISSCLSSYFSITLTCMVIDITKIYHEMSHIYLHVRLFFSMNFALYV